MNLYICNLYEIISYKIDYNFYLSNYSLEMGNKICCEDHRNNKGDTQLTIVVKHQLQQDREEEKEEYPTEIPKLAQPIQQHLDRQRPLYDMLPNQPTKVIRYGNDVYEGLVDQEGRPKEFGKMYHQNGSFFIGKFRQGLASGQGHYVLPNGSFYHGDFIRNKANDTQGIFWSPQFEYKGGFDDNLFNGKAIQKSPNHTFQGLYANGKKINGVLKWTQRGEKLTYEGEFNPQGKPHGKGRLTQPIGIYQGQFKNGMKHGKGQFKFKNGLKYEGDYRNNLREGQGKITNFGGVVPYQGQFKKGLPDGKGIIKTDGQLYQTYWIQGIDKQLL